jgi:hypothetical protein
MSASRVVRLNIVGALTAVKNIVLPDLTGHSPQVDSTRTITGTNYRHPIKNDVVLHHQDRYRSDEKTGHRTGAAMFPGC